MLIFGEKLFKNPFKTIKAFNSDEFRQAFYEMEQLSKKYYLAGYIRYEAKDVFAGKNIVNDFPLLYFEVFENYEEFNPEYPSLISLNTRRDLVYSEYENAISEIKEEIACGNTYEVNYTYDWKVDFEGDEFELFNSLLSRQKTPYNAFIKNDYDSVLSFSPELFFKLKNGHILTKPMKGTVERGKDYEKDRENIEFLRNDIKNRAENVMIVDLLRNDLGRIAKTGSVNVSELFAIETHKTLHQMTSQIEAELEEGVTLFDVFKALFPCGSITGAPKVSTMKIIERVEKGLRDIYCGAIGVISPEETVFSVPIRILQKKNFETSYRCRVGGAVVWDSGTKEEWDESFTKAKFLSDDFKLVETVKVQNKSLFLGEEHLKRLKNSAEILGFNFNEDLYNLEPERDGILRILLSRDGTFETEYKKLERTPVYKIKFSEITVNSRNDFLKHKTTFKPYYEEVYGKISAGEVYDELFFNERGELTEGARTNVLLEIGGKFYTPPIECGLLNGVLRQNLIDSGVCSEKILYKNDVLNAENIYCINSVRGIKRVSL